MKVIDPGHAYELSAGNGLRFMRKAGGRVVRNGTTNEEVLEVVIHRLTGGFELLPCRETIRALFLLREALNALQERSERRMDAGVEGTPHPVGHASELVEASAQRPRYRRVGPIASTSH
jgi:hypothetical protein